MKALDTNILIRFLTGDDERQADAVCKLFQQAESERSVFFVPLLVVMEMIWVLESVYDISRADILDALNDLLLMPILKFEHQSAVRQFLNSAQGNSHDLSDLLIGHCARIRGCEAVITFDLKASRSPLFELLM